MENEDKESLLSRREFLSGLKKWSKVVIAAAVGVAVGSKASAGVWANRRGSWGNSGGGSWANRRGPGGWLNGR